MWRIAFLFQKTRHFFSSVAEDIVWYSGQPKQGLPFNWLHVKEKLVFPIRFLPFILLVQKLLLPLLSVVFTYALSEEIFLYRKSSFISILLRDILCCRGNWICHSCSVSFNFISQWEVQQWCGQNNLLLLKGLISQKLLYCFCYWPRRCSEPISTFHRHIQEMTQPPLFSSYPSINTDCSG